MFSYQFHIRDYLTKTRHLSLLEDLAYRRLIDAYYTSEAPLPLDPSLCARQIAMREHVEAVADVLKEFFTNTDVGWVNHRCDVEIKKYRANVDRAHHAVKVRWGSRSTTDASIDASIDASMDASMNPSMKTSMKTSTDSSMNASMDTSMNTGRKQSCVPTINHKPITKNHKPNKHPLPPAGEAAFAAFWSAYPKKVAKDAALKAFTVAWAENGEAFTPVVMKTLAAYKRIPQWKKEGGQFIPNAATWLNGKRWEDEIASADDFELSRAV